MNTRAHFISAIVVSTYLAAGCGGGPLPDNPGPLTAATQAMTPYYEGMSITAPPGEDAIHATGAHGVVAIGSTWEGVVGFGAPGSAGGYFRSGTTPTATAPQVGVWSTGFIKFQDTPAPAPNVPIVNAVTPSNVAKAWVVFSTNGPGTYTVSVLDGSNIGAMAVEADSVVLSMAAPTGGQCAALATGINTPLLCHTSCGGGVVFVRCHKIMSNGTLSPYNFGGEPPTSMSLVVFGTQ